MSIKLSWVNTHFHKTCFSLHSIAECDNKKNEPVKLSYTDVTQYTWDLLVCMSEAAIQRCYTIHLGSNGLQE